MVNQWNALKGHLTAFLLAQYTLLFNLIDNVFTRLTPGDTEKLRESVSLIMQGFAGIRSVLEKPFKEAAEETQQSALAKTFLQAADGLETFVTPYLIGLGLVQDTHLTEEDKARVAQLWEERCQHKTHQTPRGKLHPTLIPVGGDEIMVQAEAFNCCGDRHIHVYYQGTHYLFTVER